MAAPRLKQWLWFVGLWAGSVTALGIVAGALRAVLR
ncbi:DUF2474 family protein [Novosphingobium piscinae]|uniref:DUF2474 family protein n=1 Tax=Novosphingobium piscinae TaxID=1507448 RepID=A0A7X1FVP8_9SPHN|nr:DUF2474 family protein [Novosphingobium piscinae]MBC2667864.1 DUF2474 family protein [Novosphingobium piscinae]